MKKFDKKNFILKWITNIAVLVWCMSACLLDSQVWSMCLVVMLISTVWITLFAYANRDYWRI